MKARLKITSQAYGEADLIQTTPNQIPGSSCRPMRVASMLTTSIKKQPKAVKDTMAPTQKTESGKQATSSRCKQNATRSTDPRAFLQLI